MYETIALLGTTALTAVAVVLDGLLCNRYALRRNLRPLRWAVIGSLFPIFVFPLIQGVGPLSWSSWRRGAALLLLLCSVPLVAPLPEFAGVAELRASTAPWVVGDTPVFVSGALVELPKQSVLLHGDVWTLYFALAAAVTYAAFFQQRAVHAALVLISVALPGAVLADLLELAIIFESVVEGSAVQYSSFLPLEMLIVVLHGVAVRRAVARAAA